MLYCEAELLDAVRDRAAGWPWCGGGAKGPLGVASKANRGEALCFHLPGTSLIATEVVACLRVSLRTCGAGDQPVTESGLRAGEI
jgi:hypothetical protein